MATPQELFNAAMDDYNKTIDLLQKTDQVLQEATGQNYDSRITLAQYDRILQGVLLTEALIDGNFDSMEKQFIEKITDYGDLLVYIDKASEGKLKLSWDDIACLSGDTKADLVGILPAVLEENCKSFCTPLAALDQAMDDVNVLEFVCKSIIAIAASLAAIDGKVEEDEGGATAIMIKELIVKYWA